MIVLQLAIAIHFETLHHGCKREGTQLDFTMWNEGLTPMTDIVQILAGLGLVTAALAYAKYYVERRQWDHFKRRSNDWLNRQVELKERWSGGTNLESEEPPAELSVFHEETLTVIVEKLLSDVGFAPLQIQQLLGTALLIVRGMAAEKFLI